MITLILSVVLSLSAASAKPACETYAPRLDGTAVTVCTGADGVGHVAKVEYVGLTR